MIEVGEYVRTKKGKIFKWSKGRTHIGNDEIIKHKKVTSLADFIDFIEVGDYVNGHRIIEVRKVPNEEIDRVLETDIVDGWDSETLTIYKEDIKTIVTKEQFASMEYKIGD